MSSSKCHSCGEKVQPDFEFCPNCGELLINDVFCEIHQDEEALGVCIICSTPVCKKCGIKTSGHYLCNIHSKYEIYEGMARVFGTNDAVNIEYVKDTLDREGLHPYIYSRKASPLSIGGQDYSLFRASGEYDGNIINEYKLMVPCQEVEDAEIILKDLEFNK